MDTFTITVILSFIGFLVVGIWVSRGINNKNDYFVAGRNVGVLFIAGTLVASFLSTVALMGEAGMAYDGFPWPILLLGVMSKMGYLAGVVLFGRYLRDSDALTIPEFFGKRFNSSRLRALAGASVLVGMGLYLVTVTRGLAVVIEAILGIDGFWAVFITWVAFTIFTVLSGSKGVIITDTMMFFFFIIGGVLGSVAIFREAGGVKETFNKLAADPTLREGLLWHGQVEGPGERLNSIGEALIYIFTFGLVWAFVTAVSPWQASRYMMAKSSHTAIRAGIVTLLIIPSFYLFVMFAAYAVNLINPDIEPNSQVFIWAAYNIMPTAIGVILVTGIVAAGLSSASTFLSLVGFSAAHDVGPMFRRGEGLDGGDTKTDNVRSARWAMLIVGGHRVAVGLYCHPERARYWLYGCIVFCCFLGNCGLRLYTVKADFRNWRVLGNVVGWCDYLDPGEHQDLRWCGLADGIPPGVVRTCGKFDRGHRWINAATSREKLLAVHFGLKAARGVGRDCRGSQGD